MTGPYSSPGRPSAEQPDNMCVWIDKSAWLGDLGRREEGLAAIQEAVTIRRELAARWPNVYQHELEHWLQVAAWLEYGGDLSDASPQEVK